MYEVVAAWQTMPTHEEPAFIADLANIWRAADKVVYSNTLKAASTPRTRIGQDFDPEVVRRLKASAARDLAVGGATLAAHAFNAGLSFVHRTDHCGGRVIVPSRTASALSWHSKVSIAWFLLRSTASRA